MFGKSTEIWTRWIDRCVTDSAVQSISMPPKLDWKSSTLPILSLLKPMPCWSQRRFCHLFQWGQGICCSWHISINSSFNTRSWNSPLRSSALQNYSKLHLRQGIRSALTKMKLNLSPWTPLAPLHPSFLIPSMKDSMRFWQRFAHLLSFAFGKHSPTQSNIGSSSRTF